MDELKGPNVQIVLHIKEGLGFGFLKSPFFVSGCLNGYLLETDPVIPSHSPVFDAELVWEADKRKFRNLRVQNVPVKVEVFSTSSQGRKDKVGYLMLSLLGAQPCPSSKIFNLKYSWHRLLGIKSEGKCCHPQLLLALSVQDRLNTPTPRNKLRMFHSNEEAYITGRSSNQQSTVRSLILCTLKEYMTESKRTASSLDLQPKLISEEGLIQIGTSPTCNNFFILSFVIGSAENIDLLLPQDPDGTIKLLPDCFVSYTVFSQTITTDNVKMATNLEGVFRTCAHINQRTSLRLRSELPSLARYFIECPYVVTKLCSADKDLGICSMDLRKLIPTDSLKDFLNDFCNNENALTIHERCHMLSCDENHLLRDDSRKPFIDIEMSLKYVSLKKEFDNVFQKQNLPSARSASHVLDSGIKKCQDIQQEDKLLNYKSGSCTHLGPDVGSVTYTNITVNNNSRYKNNLNEFAHPVEHNTEIRDLIKQMCDSFAESQERLLAFKCRPETSDVQIQCETKEADNNDTNGLVVEQRTPVEKQKEKENSLPNLEKDATSTENVVNKLLSSAEKDEMINKFVNELEDWKEKQEDLYKCQLKKKEEYYLDLLAKEWNKKRSELERKLNKGIEQCRNLATELSQATEEFRLKSFKNAERERKLLEAKKALEDHYTAKYQELRIVSQKMEEDMHHQFKVKDMRIEELEMTIQQLEKQVENLKKTVTNSESASQNKDSILTKNQAESLIQEMKILEQKLESAVQSKTFFKEQWGRAVKELQMMRMRERRRLLENVKSGEPLRVTSLDRKYDLEENIMDLDSGDAKRLKDELNVDILSKSLDTNSRIEEIIDQSGFRNLADNPVADKLKELTKRRSRLLEEDSPDEDTLKKLNSEITNILLNPGV